jgi:hypothetical protein
MGAMLRIRLTLTGPGQGEVGGEIISLNCCKWLQINSTFFQAITHQGCQLPTRWGGNTPSCAIRPSIAADYTAALTPNPEGTAPLSPALDRPGQRGSGPTLGKRRIMPPNPEGGCICLSTHRLGFPLWAPLFRSARMGRRLTARQAFRKASSLAIETLLARRRFGFTKLLCLRHHHTDRRVC